MKLRFNRQEMTDVLFAICSVAAARTPKDVLKCVRIEAQPDVLLLSATDLELGLRCAVTQVEVDAVLTRHGDDPRRWRVPVHLRPAIQRRRDWDACRPVMTEQQAVAEARRCYGCGCGAGCEQCARLCHQFAYSLDGWQMSLDHDKCVGCGMCVWLCPNHNVVMRQTSDTPL